MYLKILDKKYGINLICVISFSLMYIIQCKLHRKYQHYDDFINNIF